MIQNFFKRTLGMATLAATAMLVASCGQNQGQQQQGTTPEVPVRTLTAQDVSFDNVYPAVIRGAADAEIRPKVSGFITRVAVQEGAQVSRGQVLFTLDDATYRAAVNQAAAAVNAAKAALATAQLNYDNSVELRKKNVVSETNLQTAANTLASAKASLAQAQAGLASARENLSFCTVTSPVSGVVGTIPYRVGNLVSPSSTQALTQVSDIKTIYAYFSLSESRLLAMAEKANGRADLVKSFPAIKLRLADGSIYGTEGKVSTISGVVDQSTGSVSIRADFANPNGLLRSGGSGSILVPYTVKQAVLVPQSATVEVLNKKYVYVLGQDNKVTYTPIEIATVDDGQNYIVTQGLKVGDRIVTAGISSLQDGVSITPITEVEYAKKQEMMKQMGAAPAKK